MTRIYIDEAGRWPLAGPIHVGLILPIKKFIKKDFQDSKQLKEQQREELFEKIKTLESDGKLLYSIGISTHTEIDKRGMTKAINITIKRGLKKLWIKNKKRELIIDGNHDFHLRKDLWIPVTTIIDGDQKVKEISMASIVAKVSRDHYMLKMHRKYPKYGFDKHKWYGTKLHYAMIEEWWVSEIHRRLFLRKFEQNKKGK